MSEIRPKDQPLSERFRLAAGRCSERRRKFRELEEMKSARLAVMKCKLIDEDPKMSDAKAERLSKASGDWAKIVRDLLEAEAAFEHSKLEVQFLRIAFDEWVTLNANHRHEHRLGSAGP